METIAEYEYTLPSWSVCAIFNGDLSGLEDWEIEAINQLGDDIAKNLPDGCQYIWGDPSEPYFQYGGNDLTNLGDEVVDIPLVILK